VTLFSVNSLAWDHSDNKFCKQSFIRNISFNLPAGKVISFHGESGCGKTTIFQILGLLWEKAAIKGNVIFHGNTNADLLSLSPKEQDRFRGESFGFVLQNSYLIPHFSCIENVAMPLFLQGESKVKALSVAENLLNEESSKNGNLPTENSLFFLRDQPANKVSQGQRQRLACLRALANNPSVVFADEPTSNLDDSSAKHVFGLLKKWKNGELLGCNDSIKNRTLLVINHNLKQSHDEEGLKADLFVNISKNNENHGPSHRIDFIDRKNINSFNELEHKINMLRLNNIF
jgi:lipoprotein-releasing system ATP-binding protein